MTAEVRLDETGTGLPVIMQHWVGRVQWLQGDTRGLAWWKAVDKRRGCCVEL